MNGKIRIVTAFWFSATGTTKKICERVAETVSQELGVMYRSLSFNDPRSRERDCVFESDELVVFGLPVYAGRVPNLLLPFLRERVKGTSTPVVPVCLYGNRDFDDCLIELRDILEENGFYALAAGAFVGEHAFSNTLAAGRPDAADLADADRLAKIAAERVMKAAAEGRQADTVAVEGCEPVRPYYTPRDRYGNTINILKVKPKTDPARCVRCGHCAAVCPMGAVDPENVAAVPGICIKCCGCIKGCPAGAKFFDDEGFLYHKKELEDLYGGRRAENKIF